MLVVARLAPKARLSLSHTFLARKEGIFRGTRLLVHCATDRL